MNKQWYKSKTLWGFGLATVVAVAQLLGVQVASETVSELVKYLAGFLGVYGLRDAQK